MAALFASGHAVDLVLLVIAVEFVFLSLRRQKPLPLADGGGAGVGGLAPAVQDMAREAPPALIQTGAASPPIPALPPSANGKGSWLDRLLALLPGVFMLLALRASLTGAPWPWIAAPLAASFPFHIADMMRRGL